MMTFGSSYREGVLKHRGLEIRLLSQRFSVMLLKISVSYRSHAI